MAIRYKDGQEDGITEDLVCSLEKPMEAENLSDAFSNTYNDQSRSKNI